MPCSRSLLSYICARPIWPAAAAACSRLARGEIIGTLLVAPTQKSQARKRWMADHLQLRGAVSVDAGAAIKVRAEGKSLLPIGMTAVEGNFQRGEVIAVRDGDGQEFARSGELLGGRGACCAASHRATSARCSGMSLSRRWSTARIWSSRADSKSTRATGKASSAVAAPDIGVQHAQH
jgi:hypothetical protein